MVTEQTPDPSRRRAMQMQRRSGTQPELAVRRALHRRGLRFFVQRAIVPGTRRTVDIVFPRSLVAVDVRGCYWHRCSKHGTRAKNNADWWTDKLAGNVARDEDTVARLESAGWRVIVIWEHEDPDDAAERVVEAVLQRRP